MAETKTRRARVEPAPEPPAPPKRLTLSSIVEMLLTRSTDHSTVSISRNVKGETSIDVQIRTGSGDVETIEDAERRAAEVYDRLAALYPPPVKPEDAEATFTRNAKGETQIVVSFASAGGPEPLTLTDVIERAGEAYETARARFPLNSGAVSA